MHQSDIHISNDKSKLDLDFIHTFLSQSYWSEGIPRALVHKAIEHSLCFGVFDGDRQVGFGRVITDYATYAYLADVFIAPEHQGLGMGKQLVETIMDHPELKGIRTFSLLTKDAHSLYARYGFEAIRDDLAMKMTRFSRY